MTTYVHEVIHHDAAKVVPGGWEHWRKYDSKLGKAL
jgi:hypothetical protein